MKLTSALTLALAISVSSQAEAGGTQTWGNVSDALAIGLPLVAAGKAFGSVATPKASKSSPIPWAPPWWQHKHSKPWFMKSGQTGPAMTASLPGTRPLHLQRLGFLTNVTPQKHRSIFMQPLGSLP